MPGHQRHQNAFLWNLFIISPLPVPWAASWDVGTRQISQRPEWRPQTVIMHIWGGMRWPRYKSSAAWGTVERVWSGIRAVTDPSEAICETHFPKNWCSGAKDPSSQTCEQSWNPAAGSLSVGACLSLSLLPRPHHHTLSSRPLSSCQVRLKVSRWSDGVWGGEMTCICPVLRKTSLK